MIQEEQITRIRVGYTKAPSLRFTGHLDMQRLWERLLRRTKLPLRYTQGFHPRARLNLASALPLGFISEAELLDFWMNEPLPTNTIQHKLEAASPEGLRILSVEAVQLNEDALQSQMSASEYEVTFFDPQDIEKLQEEVSALLSQEEILRTRRNKTYDLRPLIIELGVTLLDEGQPGLKMLLLAEMGATGRPDEVLDALGFKNTEYLVKRKKLILNRD